MGRLVRFVGCGLMSLPLPENALLEKPGPAAKVFAAPTAPAVLCFCGSIPFLIFGLAGLEVVGMESWYFFGMFAIGGIFGVAIAFMQIVTEIVVGPETLSFRLCGWTSKSWKWDQIEAWASVEMEPSEEAKDEIWSQLKGQRNESLWRVPLDGFKSKGVVFRVAKSNWPLLIADSHFADPFAAFVTALRERIGEREIKLQKSRSNVDEPVQPVTSSMMQQR
jgi:hypothetical protein